jgi:hypothetical protein
MSFIEATFPATLATPQSAAETAVRAIAFTVSIRDNLSAGCL